MRVRLVRAIEKPMHTFVKLSFAAIMLAPAGGFAAEAAARIEAGSFKSVLSLTERAEEVVIGEFLLARKPVTNREFLGFVRRYPDWRRDAAMPLFADQNYLAHWEGALTLGATALPGQPLINVSWFAARAYCEAEGGRLPTWHEWEYVAAADETETDARSNPAWRQTILSWYSETGGKALPEVGGRSANAWAVHDMHGLIWEWVDDFNALLVSGDSREQSGADKMQFCGAGAAAMEEKENYAVLMRTAMLSSLRGRDTTRNLGFRCAYDASRNPSATMRTRGE
ncbi:MAG: formylglycine-generating enzyme family protein [Woeseia sp.]